MLRHTSLVLLLLWLTGCSSEQKNQISADGSGNGYVENLKSSLNEISAEWHEHPATESLFEPSYLLISGNENLLIAGDKADLSLHLFSMEGELLSKAGGIGRGPGEYESILWPHIGIDNHLYVIDGLLFRISIYEISNQELTLVKTIPFKNPENYYLVRIYVTEHGYFGIYQDSEGFFTPDNRHLLYRLNEQIEPVEQLLELPGQERQIRVTEHFTFYLPFRYLSQLIWHIDRDWFYYITTLDSSVYRYNLKTGKHEEISIYQFDERVNSREFVDTVKRNATREEIEDHYWAPLEEIKLLPIFSGLFVDGNDIYRIIRSEPGHHSIVVRMNINTEDLNYIEIPEYFMIRSVQGNKLHGIDFNRDDDFRIVTIEM